MKNITLETVLEEAKKLGSYFVTVTTKDESKEEGNLNHYAFREKFPTDDLIPSVDKCVSSLGIKPQASLPVVQAPLIRPDAKPLKIAIISHFNRAPDSYSPGRAVRNQIKLLQKFGHEVVFFVVEGSKLDAGCEMRPVVPAFKREKGVVNEEGKQKFIDMLREHLTSDFDIAITHDLYIQDCKTFREGIKECGVNIPFLHWARSGVAETINFDHPRARYVYMNNADAGLFASKLNVPMEKVRVVFNEKDPSLMFNWEPTTTLIVNKMRLWEKDIVQTYPMCTTRMDAKGINSVISVFGALKKQGKKVALIICNSNGRKRLSEIEAKEKFALENGLTEEDFLFTSSLATDEFPIHSEVKNIVVAQLMQVSNLFIFPTIAEVSSNVLLEASMTKQLLVLNEDLPSLFDFVDRSAVLSAKFTSLRSIHYEGRDEASYDKLAKQIIGQLESNKADKQFRHVWRTNCLDSIYWNQLAPILYEDVK